MDESMLSSQELAEERRKAADEAAHVRYLNPGDFIVFEQDGVFRLTLPDDRTYLKFSVYRTFPLSMPEKYISLRSDMDEICMIRDLSDFDKGTQQIIRELLNRRYFVPRVLKINGAKERYGGMVLDVETDRGRKLIITKSLHESLSENAAGRCFITDVEGNRYEINMDDESSAEVVTWIQQRI
ncbi:MAG TPA: DUF1854 domain-containing protein [Armatimonadota bacterium]|nr:DUF1854 domain-containing protein [Armatimonadota bacterium]